MAEAALAPSFGAELKDAFKPVNAWVSNGINWLDDIQQFYRERSAIEKEYSAKLSALAKRYHEKKAKKIGPLSVGDTPSLTPGSLESASLTTWTTQLATLEKRAAEHDRYAVELLHQIAEPIKNVSLRFEEVRKSHVEYATKLEKERDAAYTTLKRSKGQYDGVCQEVESRRKKIESSFDSSKAKAQNAYQQQLAEMNNVKNSYLISINVTNKQKEKYYHEYVPDLLDSLQGLSETRIFFTNSMWSLASRIENDTLMRSVDHMNFLSSEIPRNDPKLDSMMFVRHNVTSWQEPADMGFEASPVWHDDAAMITDESAKIFLKNILLRSKAQRNELKQEVDQKQREVEKARQVRQNIRDGKDKRDEVEVVRAIFTMQEDLHESERKWITAEVETSTITSLVGDISIGAQNHNFKSQTFKIPTNCDLCGERIWGLSAKGFDCKDCGYTCHSKCELKVPADCPGEQTKEQKKKLKAERQEAANAAMAVPLANGGAPPPGVSELPSLERNNTMNSLSSGYATSAHRSISGAGNAPPSGIGHDGTTAPRRTIAPPPTSYVSEVPGDVPNGESSKSEIRGKMLYPYTASGDDEVSVDADTEVVLVEADDGSGWIKIKAGNLTGIVPASYCELRPATPIPDRPLSNYSTSSASVGGSVTAPSGKKKGPAVAPKRGAKKLHYVEALYDYTAQSDAEFSISAGDRFVVVNRDSGDGWAEVEKGGQTKSVPANYVQDV